MKVEKEKAADAQSIATKIYEARIGTVILGLRKSVGEAR
jgi:hypothetical protein